MVTSTSNHSCSNANGFEDRLLRAEVLPTSDLAVTELHYGARRARAGNAKSDPILGPSGRLLDLFKGHIEATVVDHPLKSIVDRLGRHAVLDRYALTFVLVKLPLNGHWRGTLRQVLVADRCARAVKRDVGLPAVRTELPHHDKGAPVVGYAPRTLPATALPDEDQAADQSEPEDY